MDPSLEYFSSVAGIVALTVGITQTLKVALADLAPFNRLPTALYAVIVSMALTYLAHDVLAVLPGELPLLLAQAVVQALMAFGVLTAPAWGKPIGASRAARETREGSSGPSRAVILLPLLLALGGAACSARSQAAALEADRTVHAALAAVQDSVEILCDRQILAPEPCRAVHRPLVSALEAGAAFNRAVAAQRETALGPLLRALSDLIEAIVQYVPEDRRPPLLARLQDVVERAFREVQ